MNTTELHLSELTQLGLLEIKGSDCRKFLQGQVTCDTNQLTDQRLLHGSHCTPKGRMVANFEALAPDGERILLRLNASALPALLASLKKYIVFAKSDIRDLSAERRIIGVQGDDLASLLTALDLTQLGQSGQGASTVVREGITYSLIDARRLECWLDAEQDLPAALAALPRADDNRLWRARDIELGRGWVEQETVEEFLPQLLNLQCEAIAGISFKKGCYTGQEIVARMHYKGKLKRHMYHFRAATEQALTPGQPLFQLHQGQSVGAVVNAVSLAGRTELLGVVTAEAAIADNICLNPEDSEKLAQVALPYAIYT
ncbi:MAG: folate-binding protein YgfZ [Gammaproteobacteria bacterium]|uniref:CAF17-like 4Fe-4S cluster assembly/insertion protein YgfZ n=1 Tax=Pseudomaricurvus alcaniphilus TaxID=1166482 RepID=UPI00140D7A4E|nr:folate-binding protein YgfZ [Pseudomaricurvus alcaniphilus]MBR9911681.1 folate-binding protein YgfZ [Gammaproteobacteria bacterium]NHN39374.1 folate-binding protein YgfZ [Pseudomaricurvus alcaniphilus]